MEFAGVFREVLGVSVLFFRGLKYTGILCMFLLACLGGGKDEVYQSR